MRALVLSLTMPMATALIAQEVVLTAQPDPPWIEATAAGQELNFDLLLANRSAVEIELVELTLLARDAADRLLFRRTLDRNGVRPSIETIPVRKVAAGETILVFNPFHTFPANFPLIRLELVAELTSAGSEATRSVQVEVRPRTRKGGAPLGLPLAGPLLLHDGHDFLAHHRRFDYRFPPIHSLGFSTNFMRYAGDFVPVDAEGRMSRGDASKNASWFGFGAPVLAAADGEVVAAVGDRPDDRRFDESTLKENPMALFGNYLVIRHAAGEFSLSAHLQQRSLRVKPGERVRAGQPVALLGASGGVSLPHLHFHLQSCPDTRCEGLPAEFRGFRRLHGGTAIPVRTGSIATGEIVERE